ncbi:MAG: hypothetical protein HY718_05380 [Planctomycetes bacterium]|nr:hypothetical protein [Planctomycetota bacterium]
MSRYETDGVLKTHGVTDDSPSLDDLREELDRLDRGGTARSSFPTHRR